MSEPKFIQGPWGRNRYMVYALNPLDSGMVSFTCHVGKAVCTEEEQAATAHLIAAAPDLYAALEALVTTPEQAVEPAKAGDAELYESAKKAIQEAKAMAKRALAKARGEAS